MSGIEHSIPSVVGEWLLNTARFDFADDGSFFDIYGPEPAGRLIVTSAGRFTAILMASGRTAPAELVDAGALFNKMMVYSGDYTVENDRIVVQVDLAQHPTWVGTQQVRLFEVEGEGLTLRSLPQIHPGFSNRTGSSIFTWTRAV